MTTKKTLLALLTPLVLAAIFALAYDAGDADAGPPGLGLAEQMPALNSAGDQVYASANVSDGTGVVTTVAAAGTYTTVGTAAPLAAGEADGSGCITYTLASNKFTVASRCGVGILRLEACLNDVQGTNAKYFLGAWHRVRSAVTTVASPIVRGGSEPTTAERSSRGCVVALVNAALSDTYDFRFDVETSGNTVTTRNANFVVTKVKNL